MTTSKIIEENKRRITEYFRDYDRTIGDKLAESTPRAKIQIGGKAIYIPTTMLESPVVKLLQTHSVSEILIKIKGKTTPILEETFLKGFINDRFGHDFEYWTYKCIKIQDKLSKKTIPFKLNKGQRELLRKFEEMRRNKVPIRVILVKARQWGGSTVIAIYMLWLQLYHYENWHSAVVAQYKGQSTNIRSMVTSLIKSYPSEVQQISLKPFEGSSTTKYIPERGARITIGSAEAPEALRSFDFAMFHASECGLWKSTPTKSADDLVQALYATVPEAEGTFICLESTAKGIGTFFHQEYLLAAKGESINKLVFIPWYKIINYATWIIKDNIIQYENNNPKTIIKDYESEINSWSEYDKYLWSEGATIEGIKWYNWYQKGKRYNNFQMKSEFPTTAEEAFQTNASTFFQQEEINTAKKTVSNPIYTGEIRGESLTGGKSLSGITLVPSNTENLCIWDYPDNQPISNRYLVTVDIGGRSLKSDWGTINVFDRATLLDPHFGALERVATWRGHADHDVFAWKSAQIAKYYNNALLVIESNTLETKHRKSEIQYEGNHFYTVLNEIADQYDNLYTRSVDPDKAKDAPTFRYGWHMNKRTKYLAYDSLQKAIREGEYIEKDIRCVNEMQWLEIKTDGSLGAVQGEHDDLVDPTAIASYVSSEEMPLPKIIKKRTGNISRQGSIASI